MTARWLSARHGKVNDGLAQGDPFPAKLAIVSAGHGAAVAGTSFVTPRRSGQVVRRATASTPVGLASGGLVKPGWPGVGQRRRLESVLAAGGRAGEALARCSAHVSLRKGGAKELGGCNREIHAARHLPLSGRGARRHYPECRLRSLLFFCSGLTSRRFRTPILLVLRRQV